MLKPLQGRIEDLVFLHAHSGSKEDSRNRVYSVSAIIIGQDGSRRSFSSNVKYAHFTERERYYSNLSKEIILRAPQPEEVKAKLHLFLKDQPVILVYNNHDNIKDVTDLCGVRRVVDLCFALEFFLPQAESYTPKALEEFLSGKKREKIKLFFRRNRRIVREAGGIHLRHCPGRPPISACRGRTQFPP